MGFLLSSISPNANLALGKISRPNTSALKPLLANLPKAIFNVCLMDIYIILRLICIFLGLGQPQYGATLRPHYPYLQIEGVGYKLIILYNSSSIPSSTRNTKTDFILLRLSGRTCTIWYPLSSSTFAIRPL